MTNTQTKLQIIREQADSLGVSYHHRAGVDKIQSLIDHYLVAQNNLNVTDEEKPTPTVESTLSKKDRLLAKPVIPMAPEKFKQQRLSEARRYVGRLVRCRIQNMNPNKKDWPGEIISTGSAKLGTFKKYVPFNSGEPYHIPQIIFDVMSEKKCSVFYNEKNSYGHQTRRSRLINEYVLEILPSLTPEELSDLGRTQALAAGQGA